MNSERKINMKESKNDTKKKKKCKECGGTGMVQVAPNARGIKKCPMCYGTGYVETK